MKTSKRKPTLLCYFGIILFYFVIFFVSCRKTTDFETKYFQRLSEHHSAYQKIATYIKNNYGHGQSKMIFVTSEELQEPICKYSHRKCIFDSKVVDFMEDHNFHNITLDEEYRACEDIFLDVIQFYVKRYEMAVLFPEIPQVYYYYYFCPQKIYEATEKNLFYYISLDEYWKMVINFDAIG